VPTIQEEVTIEDEQNRGGGS